MKRYIIVCSSIALLIIFGMVIITNIQRIPEEFIPENGCVPDEETAIKIAEAIWLPIYGDYIYKSTPFYATYDIIHGCWHVRGTLPQNMLGGVPEAKIKKSDGQILYINHGE